VHPRVPVRALDRVLSSEILIAHPLLHKLNVYSTHSIFVPVPNHPPETKHCPGKESVLQASSLTLILPIPKRCSGSS
jgi:hypothetical protein